MRPKAAFLFLSTFVAVFCFGTAAFAALEGGITPTPQDNPNADTSLSRSVDLSLPSAGVTDSQGADTGSSNNDPTAPKNNPCYNLVQQGAQQQSYSKQSNDETCEALWKQSGYSTQTFCKNNAYSAGTVSYIDDSGNQSQIGDRCTQISGTASTVAAQAIAQNVIQNIDPTTTAGQQQLSQALQNIGVSQQDAQTAVANNAQGVKDLLTQVAQGNSNAAQNTAQSLGLNANLFNTQNLQPNNLPNVLSGVASQNQLTNMTDALNSPSTFSSGDNGTGDGSQQQNTSQSAGQCGVSGYAGGLAYAETRCGVNTVNPYSTVQGPYQFLCSTWNGYANSTGNSQYTCSCGSQGGYAGSCSYVNDPAISSNVVNSYYNNWIQGSQGQACIAAGNTDTSCVYAYHWLGSGGLNAALNLETSNPNGSASQLCSSAASAACSGGNMSLNGLTMSQVFQQLDARQGIGSGTVIASMSSAGSPVAAATGNLFSSATDGGVNGATVAAGTSPLAAASVLPSSNQNSSLNSLLPLLLMKSLLNNSATQSTSPPPPPVQSAATTPTVTQTTSAQTQTSTTGTTQTANVPPSATITAQPAIVVPGNAIQVAWSSAGVSTNPACQVTENGTLLLQTNNGSDSIPTSSKTPTGKQTFTITCTAASGGQSLQQSASVIIN